MSVEKPTWNGDIKNIIASAKKTSQNEDTKIFKIKSSEKIKYN